MYLGSVDWSGTFQLLQPCDTTICCCPQNNITLRRYNSHVNGTLQLGGFDCKSSDTTASIIITNENKNTTSLVSLGNFTMHQDGRLEILLEQVIIFCVCYFCVRFVNWILQPKK